MTKYLFGDLVKEVKNKVDRDNNPYDYFIAGDHMDTDELHLLRRGVFAGNDVGPAFIRVFKPGQVLYGSRRTYLRKVAVADFEGVTANTTFVLESKDEKILLQRLLPFIMQADRFVQHSIKRSKGSTNPYVLFSDLADYEVELPDIDKQCELADLLWAMDDVRMSYQKLISATDALVKSQFIEMFGTISAPIYPVKKLSDYAHIKHGYAFKGDDFSDDDNGILLVTPGNFSIGGGFQYKKCKYFTGEYTQEYVLHTGDLIVTMTDLSKASDTLGNAAIVPNDGYVYLHNQRIGLFDLLDDGIDKTYLEFYMRTDDYRNHILSGAAGSTVKHTSPAKILEAKFIFPPIEKQKEFSEIKEQSDKSKFELEQALSELNATYKRIIAENLG